jgi:sugar porter (SP) family MFS transporter
VNGLFQVGGLIGVLSSIWIADKFGRRMALFVNAIIVVVGGALQAGSVAVSMFIVFRFVTGWGTGALVALVPLYQSEISPPKIRGFLVGSHGVLLCVGYSVASWVGLGFYFVNASGAQWRIPLAIQCIFPLALAAGVLFLPESPRWLIDHDRIEDAYKAFHSTHAESTDDDTASAIEFEKLRQQIKMEEGEPTSFKDLWTHKSLRKRCIVGFLTLFAGQGTATIVINNYGPLLYKSLGYQTVMVLILQGAWISVCPFGNVFNSLVVDKTGRTRLMAAGLSGCVLALVGECITVSIFQKNGDKGAAAGAVFFLFLHIAFYSTTMDATSYIYAAEIFPTPVRAKGIAISVSGLFVATIIFLEAAPTAFANIGWKYYTVFISVTTVMVVVILLYFPEVSSTSFVSTSILTLSRPNDDLLKISASSLAIHHISLTWTM